MSRHPISSNDERDLEDKEEFLNYLVQSSSVKAILLRRHRIVIPASLRRRVVMVAHEGDQGIAKTKSLLRAKVWFPKLDFMVEDFIKTCHACCSVSKMKDMNHYK